MKSDKILEMLKGLVLKVQGLSRTQAIIAATATVVAVGGAGTGGYFLYESGHQPQETVAEAVPGTEQTETTEVQTEEVETETEEVLVAEVVLETEETEAAEVEARELTLVGTSMERDLKIKIQDQHAKLVTGESFVVSVAQNQNGAKTTTYEDKDKDGIIYIDDIKAGDYKVVLEELEGYTIKKGDITVTVKDELEYKKVDVTAEIKTESQVNTAVEDTAVNNVPVESVMTDTVPLLESTVTTTKVEKSTVDPSNFTHATASDTMLTQTVAKTVGSVPSTQQPGSTGTETTEPGTTEPGTTEPGTTEPGTTEPGTTEPGTTEPGTTESEPTSGTTEETSGSTEPMSDSTEPTSGTTEETSGSTEPATVSVDGTDTASVSRNRVRYVAAGENAVTATVSVPSRITLYAGGGTASTSYTVKPVISGDASIIQSITWSDSTNPAYSVTKGSDYSATIAYTGTGFGDGYINATITYVKDASGATETKTITIVAAIAAMTDSDTVLKDTAGNILYLDEKATKQATLKDYNNATVFYTAPKYTGWQTVDGKVYYYDANHNAVTGNQIIGGVTYTFSGDGSLAQSNGSRGIDVSKWQGNIDWGAVAASGISFAIIRVGYRGASTGALIEDPYFKKNIAGATRAGIKVGVYFFTQAITEAEAVEEASMVLSLISGYRVSYPVFIDTENASNGRANGLNTAVRTAVVQAFCRTIANGGYKPGVYASKNWYNTKLNASALNSYCIWVAQYSSSCTYSGKHDIWQHTSKGSVPGISGNVDLNMSYVGY